MVSEGFPNMSATLQSHQSEKPTVFNASQPVRCAIHSLIPPGARLRRTDLKIHVDQSVKADTNDRSVLLLTGRKLESVDPRLPIPIPVIRQILIGVIHRAVVHRIHGYCAVVAPSGLLGLRAASRHHRLLGASEAAK